MFLARRHLQPDMSFLLVHPVVVPALGSAAPSGGQHDTLDPTPGANRAPYRNGDTLHKELRVLSAELTSLVTPAAA
jgi:hypothetical protein